MPSPSLVQGSKDKDCGKSSTGGAEQYWDEVVKRKPSELGDKPGLDCIGPEAGVGPLGHLYTV